ncbi:3-oxoacyl-ACP reductase [Virgisporangium aliadipatigenens]|uniref:3-oxoacyl-ACP reductase n=1 Tax=Virgisporangium aliadipatigenens TaxID=741659 RepID=A0A8J4DVD5_9ACTN|nr:glucose 1-dehydrogenase [Virgisporangium aliadipatigenens]GIJ51684.1 3-oxoacyl-ACP reductase [Virgisporangium aliadipatigenens]
MTGLRLDGRVALVTGSTRGIGWCTARALAAHGATVIVNSRADAEAAKARAAELTEAHCVPADALACDAADPEQIREAYRRIFGTHRRLDILVNNAGILEDALIGMISDDLVERVLRVNTFGPLHHLQAAARLMRRHGGGAIVNLTSIIGTHGNVGQAVYGSAKAAVVGLTRSAAKELAPHGIRVNAVAPGLIDTDMTRGIPPERYRELVDGIGMGRVGTPEQVANAVLFLAGDLAAYITGQVLGVDGGMRI